MMKHVLTVLALAAVAGAVLATPAQDEILARYLAEAQRADPAFAGFAAERGEALFRGRHAGGDAQTPTCTSCHSDDPRARGENVKTGKAIEPMAVSANPTRYTDAGDVEKWFRRNCNQVLGRECTAAEKGDFITFMMTH